MSYIPTNYSSNINGALVDLGQLNNNTASVKIVPLEKYTNTDTYVSFPGRTVVNESAITVSMEDNGTITGNQTYTFGPQRRGMWVAVGQGLSAIPEIAYSYDGINWISTRSDGSLADGYTVAWNGTMWVAGGITTTASVVSGQIVYSYDGFSWHNAHSNGGLTQSCLVVAWNGTMWVAGGTGTNTIATSLDGINWISVASESRGGLNSDCRSINWNGTMWVAGGQTSAPAGAIAYSYDGINWTAASSNGGISYAVRCISNWNGTMWIAGGIKSLTESLTECGMAYSYDGKTWTAISSIGGLAHSCWGVAWNGIMWVAVGLSSATVGGIIYSYDGFNWIAATSNGGLAVEVRSIVWNGTMWVAGGKVTNTTTSTNNLAYSYDGINWTNGNSINSLNRYCLTVAWNGALQHTITIPRPMYVAGLNNGTIIYSYDGKTWNNAIMPASITSTIQIKSVKYNGKIWVAVGGNAYVGQVNITVIIYSYDGITWKSDTINPVATTHQMIESVDYNETMWIATVYGQALLLYSYNGIVWNYITNVSNDSAGCIKWNGTMWVAAGRSYNNESSTVAYSYNGLDWFAAPSIKTLTNVRGFSFIEWNGTLWIGGGLPNGAYIWGSYNGINWFLIFKTDGQTDAPGSVSWDGSKWIMCCGNKTEISYDGFGWVTNNTTDVGNIIKFVGSLWIIGGMADTIRYSSDGVIWTTTTITGTVQCIESTHSKPYTVSITPSVIGCGGGFTRISDDGRNWRSIYDGGWWTQISSNQNGLLYVAVGNSTATDKLAYSYDLNTWTGLGSTIFSTSGNGVACNGSMWVAVGGVSTGGEINTIAYSYNGITWTGLGRSIFSTAGNSVAWNGSMWVAVGTGTNTIATSTDGITWTGGGIAIFTTAGNSVEWNGTMWVAVGSGTNTIAISTDGITWTGRGIAIFTTAGNSVAWNGKLWVAVGAGTHTVARSSDGLNWTGLNADIFGGTGYSVVWNGKQFIAAGRTGTGAGHSVASSSDGIDWIGFANRVFPNTTNFIKLSVLNKGFALNSNGISGTQNIEINPGVYNNNTNNVNINIQGLSVRKT